MYTATSSSLARRARRGGGRGPPRRPATDSSSRASARKIVSASAAPSASSVSRRMPASSRSTPARGREVSVPVTTSMPSIYGIAARDLASVPRGARARARRRRERPTRARQLGAARAAPRRSVSGSSPSRTPPSAAPFFLGTKPTRTLTLNGLCLLRPPLDSGTFSVSRLRRPLEVRGRRSRGSRRCR